jgi:hypothetical protein
MSNLQPKTKMRPPTKACFACIAALLALFVVLMLSGCVTGADGKQHLSPEVQAAANRIAVSTLTAAEAAIVAKIEQGMKVHPQK